MPFDIQLKGFIIGVLFAWFVIPWLQSMLAQMKSPRPTAA